MRILLVGCLVLVGSELGAQVNNSGVEIPVSGKIQSSGGKAIYPCFIKFTRLDSDSPVLKSRTDSSGFFRLKLLLPGKYRLNAVAEGYEMYTGTFSFEDNSEYYDLRILCMKDSDTGKLREVLIVEDVVAVRIKGDTTEHAASSYKTNPDATSEDLVIKMPGMSSQNGKIQAQGEEVKRVLVDGKLSFGDDPSSTLRNLPAEVVEKIQVFDGKSNLALATGFDDGNTTKTINIITKMKFRNGSFGKAYAGYGTDERFRNGFTYNRFKNQRRITILGSLNNVNEQNFSTEDLMGVMAGGGGGGGMRNMPGGGSWKPMMRNSNYGATAMDNFLVDQRNGISTTEAFGLNYSNYWKKAEVSASYFFNRSVNENVCITKRYFVTGSESQLNYQENSTSEILNSNHRFNLRYEWKPDSMHSLLIAPKFSFQNNNPESDVTGLNSIIRPPFISRVDINKAVNQYVSNLKGFNGSIGFQYTVRFKKTGRSLTLGATPTVSGNNGNNDWRTENDRPTDTFAASINDVRANQIRENYGSSGSVTWTEPAGKNGQLSFSVNGNYSRSKNDIETNALDTAKEIYSILDTLLSSKFDSRYTSASAGLAYRWQKGKWSWNVSLNAQRATLFNEQVFPKLYNLNTSFPSLLPGAMVIFKPNEKEGLRIFYRTNNNAPSIYQLQDVVNNSNPLSVSTGNPNLAQDLQHGIFMRYSRANPKKGNSLFAMIGGTLTRNYVSNSAFIATSDTQLLPGLFLNRGAQFTRPVNMNGQGGLRSFINYGLPLSSLKCNFNINVGIIYGRTPGMVNGLMNYSNSLSPSIGVVLSSNISEKVDFIISSNTSVTEVKNTLQTSLDSRFTNQSSRFRIQVQPWKGLVLQTDIYHQLFKGLSGGLNNNFLLWNAGIGYKFLKKRAAEIRFTAFDLMKQNNSLNRNITETYYEDVQTNVLQRYYMLTFTYNLRAFKLPEGKEGRDERKMWHPR
ncbi:MAG: TonB-dependent receptor [Bacteroidetes bacterium]|nr:TonB-dependent receptor [Bacteroidota bacterium]